MHIVHIKASKKQLAKELGVSRQSLYYKPKLPEKDLKLKAEIESVFKRLEKMITFISKKKYQDNSIEETSEFYDCCSEIYNLIFKEEVKEIQFILITDSNLPTSMYHIDNKSVGHSQYSY
jgi:DNA-binding XRE family transcriptional regulator